MYEVHKARAGKRISGVFSGSQYETKRDPLSKLNKTVRAVRRAGMELK
jgi:hypothetical protein